MQRHYKLRPSRSLALLLTLLGATLLAMLWQLPLPPPGLIALSTLVLCWSGYRLFLEANLRMGHSCMAFRLEESDKVVLLLRDGRHLPCRVGPDSLVTPYCVVMSLFVGEQRRGRRVLIMRDAMRAESFRRLRVALRWGGKAAA